MKRSCPNCAAEAQVIHLNTKDQLVKCAVCGFVYRFADTLESDNTAHRPKQFLGSRRPQNVQIDSQDGALTIYWRWADWGYLVLTVVVLVWNANLFSFIKRTVELDSAFTNIWLLPFLPFVILGIGSGYFVLCGYVNETRVRVDNQTITVNHGPLPWFDNKMIKTSGVTELYITRNLSARHNSWGGKIWGGVYEVWITLGTGKHDKLLSGLDTAEHAHFVKQAIERHLGIEDRPVQGEYGR